MHRAYTISSAIVLLAGLGMTARGGYLLYTNAEAISQGLDRERAAYGITLDKKVEQVRLQRVDAFGRGASYVLYGLPLLAVSAAILGMGKLHTYEHKQPEALESFSTVPGRYQKEVYH